MPHTTAPAVAVGAADFDHHKVLPSVPAVPPSAEPADGTRSMSRSRSRCRLCIGYWDPCSVQDAVWSWQLRLTQLIRAKLR